jgi:NADH-quinone oxidoreductase subunit L
MIASFVIVVFGYTFISHAFDLFLYPDQAFAARLYAAAGIDVLWFNAIVIMLTLAIIVNWLYTYYSGRKGYYVEKLYKPLWLAFYNLLSREFYIIELYTALVRRLDGLATRINIWLRWV